MKYLFVDDKIIMNLVVKIGSSTFKLAHVQNRIGQEKQIGERNYSEPPRLSINRYSPEEIRYRLDNYFSHLTVRHPFERIVSSYYDKCKCGRSNCLPVTYFKTGKREKVDTSTIKPVTYFKKGKRQKVDTSTIKTFPEFVDFILKTDNAHWRPLTRCNICSVRFDYIVKLETIDEDYEYIVNNIMRGRYPKERLIHESEKSKKNINFRDMFKELTQEQVALMYEQYYEDFIVFGYKGWGFTDI